MSWSAIAKAFAICVSAFPALIWIKLYVEAPDAIFLPAVAALYAIPALVGWRRPRTATFLLVGIAALGLWATRSADWTTGTLIILFCGFPLISALAFGVACRYEDEDEQVTPETPLRGLAIALVCVLFVSAVVLWRVGVTGD